MSSSTMTTLLSGAKYFLLKILRLLFSRQSHHEFNRDGTWLNMIDFCMSFLSKLPRLPQVICRIAKNLLLALRRPKSIIFTALYLRIYRLIWPKPKTTFYSLPREIRDEIYYYALCTPNDRYPAIYPLGPIDVANYRNIKYCDDVQGRPKGIVWGTPEFWFRLQEFERCGLLPMTHIANETEDRALGLLFTSRMVSREAAEMLYRHTTFALLDKGPFNWLELWRFLRRIGPENRRYIRNLLIVNHGFRKELWQRADGVLVDAESVSFVSRGGKDIVWDPEYHPPLDPTASVRAAWVDVLDPSMRKCMRMLGPLGPKLRFLILDWRYTSGRNTYIVQMVERYAQEETGGRVEVVWAGSWLWYDEDESSDSEVESIDSEEEQRFLKQSGWQDIEESSDERMPEISRKMRWTGAAKK